MRAAHLAAVKVKMKSYSVHWINIVVIGVGLLILSDITFQEIIDPTYHVVSSRYMPRALMWYITAYGVYKFLTSAYKISFFGDGTIRLYSILRKTNINTNEIIKIKSYIMFVDIVTARGTYAVSSLMDGISNIKNVLVPIANDTSKKEDDSGIWASGEIDRNKIIKICFYIILIIIAVFVEWQQIRLRFK
jgi:hypothetical protein